MFVKPSMVVAIKFVSFEKSVCCHIIIVKQLLFASCNLAVLTSQFAVISFCAFESLHPTFSEIHEYSQDMDMNTLCIIILAHALQSKST